MKTPSKQNLKEFMAAEIGFEPIQTESESAVLPLHNSASVNDIYYIPSAEKVKTFMKKL